MMSVSLEVSMRESNVNNCFFAYFAGCVVNESKFEVKTALVTLG